MRHVNSYLSTITHRSANTWPQGTTSSTSVTCCPTLRRIKQTEHHSYTLCVHVHLGSATTNVCIRNEEWISACANCFSCSFILLSSSSHSNYVLYPSVSQTFCVCVYPGACSIKRLLDWWSFVKKTVLFQRFAQFSHSLEDVNNNSSGLLICFSSYLVTVGNDVKK